ncbi:BPSL1445 family SYLF domain-containing lipoprotein [Marinicella gelatinilytica]|uniref:BPSL1445 family SYLF domain-containing lipoprotein n=1 Tax=Marinicella gelatinilytica TaxID=2996017 RepID=UPI0022610457|nr:YSC84-related protein [Marinicella gelatinilytica]MCX7544365.1 YSC84-related protein [Marinicella gelatinilytica]
MKIRQLSLLLGILIMLPIIAHSKSAQEINILADATLQRFNKEVTGGQQFLNQAVGVLVFPQVLKAGLGVGGEYGEGVLREGGKNTAYYSTASASFGFQAGAQSKSVVIVFLEQSALNKFKQAKGWKAGVDGSVAIVKWGVGEDINTMDFKDPIVGFVFGNKGLMFNLTLEGSKITRITR